MKTTLQIIGIVVGLIFAGLVIRSCNTGVGLFDATVSTENVISSYEEFEDEYAACQKICQNIQVLKAKKTSDANFSNEDRISALEMNLSKVVSEYNANTHKFRKSLWKRKDLPYQLDPNTICTQTP
jgi:hypothetical protein